jgi:hypothetical protein
LLQLLSCRRLQYTVCDLQIQFCRFLAISLKVLYISCKFLGSSLQILCKLLAKFLARSLQEFSAGGGKRGKVGPQMAPKSIQNGANLAQGVGKGYPKINKNMKHRKKAANANTHIQSFSFLMCGDFLKTRRAQRLGVYRCFLNNKK